MSYFKDNTETELITIDKNDKGDKIKVTKIENNKYGTSYDIRQMYTNGNGEIKHTQKGVRIDSDSIVDIIISLAKGMDEDQKQDLYLSIRDMEDNDYDDVYNDGKYNNYDEEEEEEEEGSNNILKWKNNDEDNDYDNDYDNMLTDDDFEFEEFEEFELEDTDF